MLTDRDSKLVAHALPVGWVQTDRSVWQRLEGYMGAPTAQITHTAVGMICDSFIMQPHRSLLLPSPNASCEALLLDAVEDAADKLRAAERGLPGAPQWMPVQDEPIVWNELGPDFPATRYFPTARGLKVAAVVAGHVIVVVQVFGAVFQSRFMASLDNAPLTTKNGELRLFRTAREAALAAKEELA